MNTLSEYIIEKFQINKKTKIVDSYSPETKEELIEDIKLLISKAKKKRDLDLNCIDVSKIEDMSYLFSGIQKDLNFKFYKVNISKWDVSNVKNMHSMFNWCQNLETDVSDWDVKNVINMQSMFLGCRKFNCDLSKWKLTNVDNIHAAFAGCESLNCDFSSWDITNVDKKKWIFNKCYKVTKFPKGYDNK